MQQGYFLSCNVVMLMYVYIVYILLFFLVVWLTQSKDKKESYFTFYKGMSGIPKSYISTTYIRDPDDGCYQNSQSS